MIAAIIGVGATLFLAILGGTWRLSAKIAEMRTELRPLASVPERVARVETGLEAHTRSDEQNFERIEAAIHDLAAAR